MLAMAHYPDHILHHHVSVENRVVELGAQAQTSSPNICGDISDDIFGAMPDDISGNIANDISSDIYDVNIWCMLRT
jgi:hypothetical protein